MGSARSLGAIISLLAGCAPRCPEPVVPEPQLQGASSQQPAPAAAPPPAETAATAEPTEAPAPTHGGLSPEQVRSVVMANVSGFQACFERLLAKDASAKGGITISFSIAPDGSIKEAVVSSSSIGSPQLEECMVNEFKELRFPAAEKQTNAVFPFVFQGAKR